MADLFVLCVKVGPSAVRAVGFVTKAHYGERKTKRGVGRGVGPQWCVEQYLLSPFGELVEQAQRCTRRADG